MPADIQEQQRAYWQRGRSKTPARNPPPALVNRSGGKDRRVRLANLMVFKRVDDEVRAKILCELSALD